MSLSPSAQQTSTLVQLPLSNGAVAVAGLTWRPLATSRPHKRETKRLLQQTQCDYFVLHHTEAHTQCGLTSTLPDRRAYHSVALLLIEQLGDHWIAVFQLPDYCYLLIGVAEGRVVPGCDRVLATDTAVSEQFERYHTLFNWQTIYAPTHLNLGGEERVLETLLNSSSPSTANQLHSYYRDHIRLKRLTSYLGAGAALLLLILGGQYYQRQQAAIRLAKQRLLQAQQKKKRQIQQIWQQHPPANALLFACARALSHYPTTLAGWRLVKGQCTARQTQITYQRQSLHTVRDFLAAAQQHYGERYQFNSSNTAQITHPLTVPGSRSQEQLQPMLTVVGNILQKMECGIATGQIDDVLTKPRKSANFELTSDTLPSILLQDIDLAGVVIHRLNITISPEGKVLWKFSGSIYGK